MDPYEAELIEKIDQARTEIDHAEDEIRKNPYWPYFCVLTFSIAPFFKGGEIGFGVGGFWLGVGLACIANQYNKNWPHYQKIKNRRRWLDQLQGMLEVHREKARHDANLQSSNIF